MKPLFEHFIGRPKHPMVKNPFYIESHGTPRWVFDKKHTSSGNMGVVHYGWDDKLHRPAVCKTWIISTDQRSKREDLWREAKLMAQIKHPNIVEVYDFIEHGNNAYIIMEHIQPAKSLNELFQNGHTFSPAELTNIFRDIGSAIDFLHSKKILHRDIKPDNILFLANGNAKLIDFGISPDVYKETTSQTIVGVPFYKPPEALIGDNIPQNKNEYGFRQFTYDIYGLGVTFATCLMGDQEKAKKLIYEYIAKNKPLTEHTELVHRFGLARVKKLDIVLGKSLSKNPENRYRTAKNFTDAVGDAFK